MTAKNTVFKKCVICMKDYECSTKPGRPNRQLRVIRAPNTQACSRTCSRVYQRVYLKVYHQIRHKNNMAIKAGVPTI